MLITIISSLFSVVFIILVALTILFLLRTSTHEKQDLKDKTAIVKCDDNINDKYQTKIRDTLQVLFDISTTQTLGSKGYPISNSDAFVSMYFKLKTPTEMKKLSYITNEFLQGGTKPEFLFDFNRSSVVMREHQQLLTLSLSERQGFLGDTDWENTITTPWFKTETNIQNEIVNGVVFKPTINGVIGDDKFEIRTRESSSTHPILFVWKSTKEYKEWFPSQPTPGNPNAEWQTPFKWRTSCQTNNGKPLCTFELLNDRDEIIKNISNVGSSFRTSFEVACDGKVKTEVFLRDGTSNPLSDLLKMAPLPPREVDEITFEQDLSMFSGTYFKPKM